METFDAIVIGAGAAGLMCAAAAGARGRRVVLLDHGTEAGAKILISGGGRCNFTNEHTAPDRFVSSNPAFCRGALSRYTPHDFIGLIERHGIAYHHKALGQLFCDGSARAVVAMLLDECAAAGVAVRLGHRVTALDHGLDYTVSTDQGGFSAPKLVLATGGLSIPKMGATAFAYDAARRFGLPIVPPRPGLVPLTFDGDDLTLMRSLSGVSLPVKARAGKLSFSEAMLFTHRGLSGPAILQASSYWDGAGPLMLDLLPGLDAGHHLLERKRSRPRAELRTLLAEILPARLAQSWPTPAGPIADQPDRVLHALATSLNQNVLRPSGNEGYPKAEVTIGGIDTRALSSQTMESRTTPGLFAIGEAVDVTGWLGGYNFQWAWASGWCAGQAL